MALAFGFALLAGAAAAQTRRAVRLSRDAGAGRGRASRTSPTAPISAGYYLDGLPRGDGASPATRGRGRHDAAGRAHTRASASRQDDGEGARTGSRLRPTAATAQALARSAMMAIDGRGMDTGSAPRQGAARGGRRKPASRRRAYNLALLLSRRPRTQATCRAPSSCCAARPRPESPTRNMRSARSTCDGRGVTRDTAEAARWLLKPRRATAISAAEVEYAILLFNGDGRAEGRGRGRALFPPGRRERQRHRAEPARAPLRGRPRRAEKPRSRRAGTSSRQARASPTHGSTPPCATSRPTTAPPARTPRAPSGRGFMSERTADMRASANRDFVLHSPCRYSPSRSDMIRSPLINVMTDAALKAGRGLKRDFGEVENLQVSRQGPRRLRLRRRPPRRGDPARRAAEGAARLRLPHGGGGVIEGTDKTHRWHRRPARRHHQLPARHAAFRDLDRAGARGPDRRGRDLQSGQGRDVHRRARQGRLSQQPPPARRRRAATSPTRSWPAACRISAAPSIRASSRSSRPSWRASRRRPPHRRGGARSRLGRRRPLDGYWERDLQPWDMARRHRAGARGRRLRHDADGGERHAGRADRSPPATRCMHRELCRFSDRRAAEREPSTAARLCPELACRMCGRCECGAASAGRRMPRDRSHGRAVDAASDLGRGSILVRMVVFLILAGFVALILYRQISDRLHGQSRPERADLRRAARSASCWRFGRSRGCSARSAGSTRFGRDPGIAAARSAGAARADGDAARRAARAAPRSRPATLRSLLDSVGDPPRREPRDRRATSTGLLVFLGLLGTFWGLIETVGSVGRVISIAATRRAMPRVLFDDLKTGARRAARGHGHRLLVLAVRPRRLADPRLPRPAGRAGAEPLLHRARGLARQPIVDDDRRADGRRRGGVRQRPRASRSTASPRRIAEGGGGRAATDQAMANLAEGIQGLVQHMRTEQQMIRDWVEAQAEQQREI